MSVFLRAVALIFTMAVFAAGLNACGDDDLGSPMSDESTETAAPAQTRCETPLAEPGEYESLSVAGPVEHPYTVVVPESYPDVAPAPLYLHLASGGGNHGANLAGWRPYLDDLPGLMAIVGTESGANTESLMALTDQIASEYCVDPSRIHVMATSWSAIMATNAACEAADRIASFSSGLGGRAPTEDCQPSRPVPLLSFTSDDDRDVDTEFVATWAELNGCDPEPAVDDLGSGVAHKTFTNCDADVEFFDIEGMDHAWPLHEAIGPGAPEVAVYAEVDYLDECLRFFAEHPLP